MRKLIFSDVTKWRLPSFKRLSPMAKLVYFYLIEDADSAGFVVKDVENISIFTGLAEDEVHQSLDDLKDRYIESGDWLWLRKYIKDQKNLNLNPEKNNAHKGIIRAIEERCDEFDAQSILQELKNQKDNSGGSKVVSSGGSKGVDLGGETSTIGKGNGNGNGKGYDNGLVVGKGKGYVNSKDNLTSPVYSEDSKPSCMRSAPAKSTW